MGLTQLAFYVFAAVAVGSGVLVILARNPVHSVLWLILAFFSSAGLMVLLGAEFIAMLLVIVYVGAVAVLFLFVVMMLDVDFAELKRGLADYLPVGALVGLVLLVELSLVLGHWALAGAAPESREAVFAIEEGVANTPALGAILYDKYLYMFQAAGLILLVAMIGAIVLTLRHRPNVKRQDVLTQIYRGRDVELKDVEPGQGV
ncbi:NADH-quinone oxidoreductase subunit J [Limibaculum sp. M0105]|uniref:NADH-quinone oxidoreductase subunit J n=1 Tax=Thermohalobaculum xanthum TaxID=2753746 RepID=A0A8J7M444_9RHOB|nr:NADH-quinone oxidoreductase subunit J [Thermohalobaculum xanthum]MBK0397785.1 NADH-quinone oxidoreductase subunit J [Thermohalobaculum xanthum]